MSYGNDALPRLRLEIQQQFCGPFDGQDGELGDGNGGAAVGRGGPPRGGGRGGRGNQPTQPPNRGRGWARGTGQAVSGGLAEVAQQWC